MTITQQELENWFTYHPPSLERQQQYLEVRLAGQMLAEKIIKNTPASADQTDAIRKVREAVMTANAAIACNGKS